jgi:hypothetical protein
MAKTNNHEKALSALLSSASIAEAAIRSALSERTLYRYLEDENFKKEYRSARRNLVENSIGQIQTATGEAVETLRKNLTCENPAVEVRAAQIILDTAYKGIELLDVLERLEVLENEFQKQD